MQMWFPTKVRVGLVFYFLNSIQTAPTPHTVPSSRLPALCLTPPLTPSTDGREATSVHKQRRLSPVPTCGAVPNGHSSNSGRLADAQLGYRNTSETQFDKSRAFFARSSERYGPGGWLIQRYMYALGTAQLRAAVCIDGRVHICTLHFAVVMSRRAMI